MWLPLNVSKCAFSEAIEMRAAMAPKMSLGMCVRTRQITRLHWGPPSPSPRSKRKCTVSWLKLGCLWCRRLATVASSLAFGAGTSSTKLTDNQTANLKRCSSSSSLYFYGSAVWKLDNCSLSHCHSTAAAAASSPQHRPELTSFLALALRKMQFTQKNKCKAQWQTRNKCKAHQKHKLTN